MLKEAAFLRADLVNPELDTITSVLVGRRSCFVFISSTQPGPWDRFQSRHSIETIVDSPATVPVITTSTSRSSLETRSTRNFDSETDSLSEAMWVLIR